jgi:hypothetical protein
MSGDLALNASEGADLATLEETIRSGLRTFVDVGQALAEIRDRRLYRETHSTFETYCEQQWALTRTRAYELISVAAITQKVSEISDTPPANEGQAKELRGLEPTDAAKVMRIAGDAGKVTASSIREARAVFATETHASAAREWTGEETAAGRELYGPSAFLARHTEPEPPSDDPVLRSLGDDPEFQRLNFQARFSADLVRARKAVLAWDAKEVGELAEPRLLDSLDELTKSLTAFTAEAHRNRTGLRLMKGAGK